MTSDTAVDAGPLADWAEWNNARHRAVTEPLGALALVLTHWSPPGEPPVAEATARAGHPEHALFTRLTRTDIDTGLPQEGYRIWRADSPASQAFEETPPCSRAAASSSGVDTARAVTAATRLHPLAAEGGAAAVVGVVAPAWPR
ncbi:hypothetical protein [Luethyella okanaganae]|uniref:Uncharacterized protein n=1 Tax=Luethyella okanaganae TaxID=69372 RepID=A0ABW1VIU6_9MICO